MNKSAFQTRRGFTLIELLLVIGIIAILASIVIVAINPTKQLGDARNAQRRSDVNTIINAIYQHAIDSGALIPNIATGTAKQICISDADQAGADTFVDVSDCLNNVASGAGSQGVTLEALTGAYLVRMPRDPQAPSNGTGTNYWIIRDTVTNRITVTARGAEQNVTISVSR